MRPSAQLFAAGIAIVVTTATYADALVAYLTSIKPPTATEDTER